MIYEGQCSCKLSYIGETKKRNSKARCKEYKDPTGKSEPAKHLIENQILSLGKYCQLHLHIFVEGKLFKVLFITLRKTALHD